LANLKTFQKYYSKSNAGAPFPKFINYVTHDEIIGAFLEGLGFHTALGAKPASGLYFEFFTKNGALFVRTY